MASSKALPRDADFRQLRNQAKDLLKAWRASDLTAAARLRQVLPEWADLSDRQVFAKPFALKDAQRTIAREYGFDSWPDLKTHLDPSTDPSPAPDLAAESQRIYGAGFRDAFALLRAYRNGEESARRRVRDAVAESPDLRDRIGADEDGEPIIGHPYTAIQIIAHEQNGTSWATMCLGRVNAAARIIGPGHPFAEAVRDNKLTHVQALLESDPSLANARLRGAAWRLNGELWEAGATAPSLAAANDDRTTTALHHAAVRRKPALAQLLVEAGADPDALGYQDNCDISPPIRLAAWEGSLATTAVLLEAGADPDIGMGAMFSALEHGRADKAELMLQHGATHDVFTAAMTGDEAALRELVDREPALLFELSPSRGRLAIQEAVNTGQFAVAGVLIELGSDVPPEVSVALGRREDVERLLAEDAGVLTNEYIDRPLIVWAAVGDQPDMVDLLVDAGADPNQPDRWGSSALAKATTERVIDRLVARGADPNLTAQRLTALMTHVQAGNEGMARALLRHGADPNQRGRAGRTALHAALDYDGDAAACVSMLLEHGADPSAIDDDGRTPLDMASEGERPEVAERLRQALG